MLGVLLVSIGCGSATARQEPARASDARAVVRTPARVELGPYALSGGGPRTGAARWDATLCEYQCGSVWVEGGFDTKSPTSSPPVTWETRSCGNEDALGVVLAAGDTVEALVENDETYTLASLSPRSLAVERELSVGKLERGVWGAASVGLRDVALGIGLGDGRVWLVRSGHGFLTAAARNWHFFLWPDALWASPTRLLVAAHAQPGKPTWESVRPDGSDSRIIAEGKVGGCGRPIIGERAVALTDKNQTVVSLALDQSSPPVLIHDVPLEFGHCVAGEGDVLAVTGRIRGLPAVAIHEAGSWSVLEFPPAASIAEPLVEDGLVVVSIPEAAFETPKGELIESAGAVFVIDKASGEWKIRERIVAAEPRSHGHFGFAVELNHDALFINHLIPGQVYDSNGAVDGFGYPRICRVTRARALRRGDEQ
jgi:hypothetical protein